MEGALPFMASRRAVILTPSRSSHPTQLLSRQQSAPISPLAATLMDLPASVANKRFIRLLSPLAATLTKNTGVGDPFSRRSDLKTFRRSDAATLALLSCFAPRVFHNSFTTKRFHTLSQNCRVYRNDSHSETPRASGLITNWLSSIPSARIASLHHPARWHAPKRG